MRLIGCLRLQLIALRESFGWAAGRGSTGAGRTWSFQARIASKVLTVRPSRAAWAGSAAARWGISTRRSGRFGLSRDTH
jgi:hypothetical protein